jgi:outer membrane immunogenic protein
MKKNILLAGATVFGLIASDIAFAADMPLKAPAVTIAQSWTGFYVGLDVGYGWKDPTVSYSPNNFAGAFALGALGINNGNGFLVGTTPTAISAGGFRNNGPFAGLEAGYNWQFNRSWVAGIEAGINASGITGQGNVVYPFGGPGTAIPPQTATMTAGQNIRWFGTIRPRLGWLATDNLLLYGTGGFAYGRVTESVTMTPSAFAAVAYGGADNSSIICTPSTTCFSGASARNAIGWTAGAGAEYRVPGTHASFKVEYLYVNLGAGDTFKVVNLTPFAGFQPGSFSANYSSTDFHTVKLGFNWKL